MGRCSYKPRNPKDGRQPPELGEAATFREKPRPGEPHFPQVPRYRVSCLPAPGRVWALGRPASRSFPRPQGGKQAALWREREVLLGQEKQWETEAGCCQPCGS